jgi:hypothetical protein
MGEMRRTIAREEQGRAKAMEEQKRNDGPVRFNAGDCRVDHCGYTGRKRAGHQ